MSSQKKRTLPSAKEKVWVVNSYNELQFNNYYNLLTMFSIFWSITSLLAFDIRSLSKNSKYFFTFFSGTVTEFFKTLTLTIHIYTDFTLNANFQWPYIMPKQCECILCIVDCNKFSSSMSFFGTMTSVPLRNNHSL
jgi:hypothetical protein